MRRTILFVLAAAAVAVSCDKDPEPATPPAAPNTGAVEPAPSDEAEPEPAKPTPEEEAKAKQEKEIADFMAKAEQDAQQKSARWTPELQAKVTALAGKDYKNTKAALKTILASDHRAPGNAERDKYRHPAEMLSFFGLKPNMKVYEMAQGQGWWTELLAPLLAKNGKLYLSGGNPDAQDSEGKAMHRLSELFISSAGNLYEKVELVPQQGEELKLGEPGSLDMVLLFRMLHNVHRSKRWDVVMPAVHAALKDGGVFAIEQHRAAKGADPDASSEKGYMPQEWVVQKIESYGFKLAKSSEMNANKKDTKDYPEGVWTLPPTLALGEKDKAKYVAIGESDRMTLKFVKVAKK